MSNLLQSREDVKKKMEILTIYLAIFAIFCHFFKNSYLTFMLITLSLTKKVFEIISFGCPTISAQRGVLSGTPGIYENM